MEEVGPPVHLDIDVGDQRNRCFKPMLADVAPRADHVGNHLDVDGRCLFFRHDANPSILAINLTHRGVARNDGYCALDAQICVKVQRPAPTTRAIRLSTLSLGFSVASVTSVAMPARCISGASIVFFSTLAIRRAMT